MDAGHYWVSLLFCIVLVIVCAFFLLRVILAFITESINYTDNDNTIEVKKREETVNSLLRARKGQKSKIYTCEEKDESSEISED